MSPAANPAPSAIREVVLTGGPCAGKTTALARIVSELPGRGWRVLTVQEAATTFICGGVPDIGSIAGDKVRWAAFQRALMNWQRRVRTSYREMAQALGGNVLIVYDRAEVDGRAYIDAPTFSALLAEEGVTVPGLRDGYDAVIHLVTAANGAEEFYSTTNNTARSETPAQARQLDARTLAAWLGHPRLFVVDNRGSFADKLDHVIAVILRTIGEPMPFEIERKFRLLTNPDLDAVVTAAGEVHTLEIEQRYTSAAKGSERRVRRIVADDTTTYVATEKRPGPDPRVRLETEAAVGVSEWLAALADTVGQPVVKTRRCFVHAGRRFELDEFHSPITGWLLEVELADADDHVDLPPFLGQLVEVTADPAWRNSAIAGC